jgi:UDP-N-acetylglucosamine 2-epimerase (non-hydrolysing)
LTDHCSDILFPSKEYNQPTLHKKALQSVFVTGNTVVDALNQNLEVSKHKYETPGRIGLCDNNYLLFFGQLKILMLARSRMMKTYDEFQGLV